MDREIYCNNVVIGVVHNISSKRISSFKSGGEIKNYYLPKSLEELKEIIKNLAKWGEPYHLIGHGTNVIIADAGVQNVISMRRIKSYEISDNVMTVSAGMSLPVCAEIAYENGLSNLERLSGIPGSIGGAICMNAGAFDDEIGDKVIDIDILSVDCVKTLQNADIKFRYRSSIAKEKGLIILSARLQLFHADKDEIYREMTRVKNKRCSSQPILPSVGSTFLRAEGVSAGAYIDALGLKGLKVGGAEVSNNHAGFIVNSGDATTNDYLELADILQRKVYCAFGVRLKNEFVYIGD